MPMLVLVVDDSMLIRHTVCRFLEERGFDVQSATNGEDAMAAVLRKRPDLIITDIQMPRMGGTELITQLKGNSETATIPIVVLSSCTKAGEADERADLAICKDIDINDQLANAVSDLLGGQPGRAATAGQ